MCPAVVTNHPEVYPHLNIIRMLLEKKCRLTPGLRITDIIGSRPRRLNCRLKWFPYRLIDKVPLLMRLKIKHLGSAVISVGNIKIMALGALNVVPVIE